MSTRLSAVALPVLAALMAAGVPRAQAQQEGEPEPAHEATLGGAPRELSEKEKRSIEKATQWLLKNQNADGSWGLNERGSPGDVTCTGLAGLALLADGNTEREGPDNAAVRAVQKGVRWMLKQARSAKGRNDIAGGVGTLIQGKLGQSIHNHFAVIFLTQVYGMRIFESGSGEENDLNALIRKLADNVAGAQATDGSWHRESFGSLKATCMAWLALRSAAFTGVPIRHATVEKTVGFIEKQYDGQAKLYLNGARGGYGYGDYQTLYATASCLRVMYGQGKGALPVVMAATDTFMNNVEKGAWSQMFLSVEGEDYLAALMMSHALVGEDGARWRRWWKFIGPALLKRQNADGSWTTTACISGRTFATACALMTLETPYRLLPIQQ